jgi:cardiolipin synthase A/B
MHATTWLHLTLLDALGSLDGVQVVMQWAWIVALLLDIVLRLALIIRVIAKRTPVPDTLTWIVLLAVVPVISVGLYVLIGENRLGARRVARFSEIQGAINRHTHLLWQHAAASNSRSPTPLERVLERVTGKPGIPASSIVVVHDAHEFLTSLIADIDAAQRHVHVLYYIWEDDSQGAQLAGAIVRAARRGVVCRVLVDSVGSADLLKSDMSREMQEAGARVVEALPANPFRALFARIDLRNHRKIAIIDNAIAHCGSQNITEENFRKRKGSRAGPWLDANVRLTGPAVLSLQAAFVADWALDSDEPLESLHPLVEDASLVKSVSTASHVPNVHLVASGPGPTPDAIHQAFLAIINGARERIVMTTPYFVPDEATKASLINAAYRGVDVVLVVPMVSDSVLVAAAGRSHYEELLDAGVNILLHSKGLLHAKTVTVDQTQSVIGSANFDMRSFWLNFEATLFIEDEGFCDTLRLVQREYIAVAQPVDAHAWRNRPRLRRFLDNCAQLLGPLL